MKCVKCGKEIQPEFNNCPYCGANLQMVPEYSIYDEEDINVLIGESKLVKPDTSRIYMEKEPRTKDGKDAKEAREKERAKRAAELKKRQRTHLTILVVVAICIALLLIAVVAKVVINNNKNNSYEYQMKQGDAAMFKGDIDIAEEHYLKALFLEPNDVEVRLELADLYLKEKDTKTAIKYLKEVIELEDQHYIAFKTLYQIYSDNDDTAAILELKNMATDTKVLALFNQYTVAAPTINMNGGTYSEEISITISAKKDLEIYYTLNGDNPMEKGTKYTGMIKLKDAGMYTLKVVTKNATGSYSAIVSELFVIEYKAPSDPIVTPDGGVFTTETYVYITIPENCNVYYVWGEGDEEPTELDTLYERPFLIPEGHHFLSVIIVDAKTGLKSGIYRGEFEYITASIQEPTVDDNYNDGSSEDGGFGDGNFDNVGIEE